jgi:lysozyme
MKGTNGERVLDSKFKQNIKNANKNKIPVGVYYFSYASSKKEAIKDAKWVLKQIKKYDVTLPVAFDWEDFRDYNSYKLSFYNLTSMADGFIEEIEKNGYKGMLYGSKNYLEQIWLPNNHNVWLAHYTDKTSYEGNYKFWQLTEIGKVDGIDGTVDIDIQYK